MSWPLSPSNGQQTTINGIVYAYDSANSVWNRVYSATVIGGGIVTAVTVTQAAQPNITSTGALTGLTVSNATGSVNFITTANVSLGAVANLHVSGGTTGQYLQTDGSGTLSWSTINSTTINNGTSNVVIPSSGSNIAMSVGGTSNVIVVTTTGANVAGYANITGDGTIGGNLIVGANLFVNGTTTTVNSSTTRIVDPIVEQGGGANGAALASNDSKDRGKLLHYYTTQPVDAFMGWDSSNAEFAFGSNVTVASEVVTFNTFGNLRVGNAVLGNLASATYLTGTLTAASAAQANITSVGTLTSLTSSGLITATGGGLKVGNIQDPSGTNTISLASGSVGILGSLNVGTGGSGNVTATYLVGTLTTKIQPNITSVGTLVDTTMGSSNSLSGGNLVSATYLSGSLTAASAAQANITSVGSLTGLTVAGTFVYQQSQEAFQTKTGATGAVTHDYSTGATFLHSSVAANFTAAITNLPSTAGRISIFATIIAQGATPYICSGVSVNGGSVLTTNWLGGVTPVGTANKTECFVFTIINNSGTYTVLGQIGSYG